MVEHKSENIVTMILFSSYQTPSLRYSLQVDYFLDLTHDSRKSEVLFVKSELGFWTFSLISVLSSNDPKLAFNPETLTLKYFFRFDYFIGFNL